MTNCNICHRAGKTGGHQYFKPLQHCNSVEIAILYVTYYWLTSIDDCKSVYAVFLEMKKIILLCAT